MSDKKPTQQPSQKESNADSNQSETQVQRDPVSRATWIGIVVVVFFLNIRTPAE